MTPAQIDWLFISGTQAQRLAAEAERQAAWLAIRCAPVQRGTH